MRHERALSAAAVTLLAMVGVITGPAPAYAASCATAAYKSKSGGYTHVSETQNTDCDRVAARTYTYIGGGISKTTYKEGFSSARAHKLSSGSYSGGAKRTMVEGIWYSWIEL